MTGWPETPIELEHQALTEGLVDEQTVVRAARRLADSGVGGRVPPHDDTLERHLLGAMLLSGVAIDDALAAGITAGDYYRPSHGHLHEAICHVGADATLVADHLHQRGLLDIVLGGDRGTLLGLMSEAPGTANAGRYASAVKEKAHLRRLISIGHDLANAGYLGDNDRIAAAVEHLTEQPFNQPVSGSLIEWDTLFDRSLTTDWLLEPLIASARGHALYAGQKAGKSLLVASVLVPAAMGRPALERPAGEPLRTLYLDFEMTREDVADRVEAMGYGRGDAACLEPLAYHVLPAMPPLDTAAGGQTVLAWARDHRAELVVFDTMARAVAGPENDADTYRDYYRHTGSILKAAGIATLRLDHAGKEQDRGQRGSSAKADDVDVVWRLRPRERDQFTLECTHRRMGWVPSKVELVRHAEPLEYVQVTSTWPAGTAEATEALDELGAPLDITNRAARALLRDNGRSAGAQALAAALKYRREIHGTPVETCGQAVLDTATRNGAESTP